VVKAIRKYLEQKHGRKGTFQTTRTLLALFKNDDTEETGYIGYKQLERNIRLNFQIDLSAGQATAVKSKYGKRNRDPRKEQWFQKQHRLSMILPQLENQQEFQKQLQMYQKQEHIGESKSGEDVEIDYKLMVQDIMRQPVETGQLGDQSKRTGHKVDAPFASEGDTDSFYDYGARQRAKELQRGLRPWKRNTAKNLTNPDKGVQLPSSLSFKPRSSVDAVTKRVNSPYPAHFYESAQRSAPDSLFSPLRPSSRSGSESSRRPSTRSSNSMHSRAFLTQR